MKTPVRLVWVGCCLLLIAGCSSRSSRPDVGAARPSTGFYHVVKPGENLFRIGKAYDVAVEELTRLNGIRDAGQIRVGQRIYVPGATRQLPVEMITPSNNAPTTREAPPPSESAGPTLLWPISGTINSGFGPRGASFHDGVDIGAAEGTPIHAIEKGEVVYSDQLRGYGNIVIVRHAGGVASVYAHNQVNLVREGQLVERGEVIAKVGSTGRVTGPHLHLEIRKNNLAQDPLLYLPQLCCGAAFDSVAPNG